MKIDISNRVVRLLRASAAVAACAGIFAGASSAQTVTGAWSPASAAGSANVTLTLSYTGFTTQNIGYKFRVYYDNTKLTFGAAASTTAPSSAYQGDSGEVADGGNGDGDAATNSYVELNWADLGNAWPTNAAGTLGTLTFTTASNFTGTSVNLRESAATAQARGVAGSSVALTFAEPAPSVTIGAFTDNTCATASPALTDSAGQTATICVISSLTRVNPLTVSLTPAATSSRYATTCGSTITIAAGQSRNTCTVTATANTTPFDGSATATTAVVAGSGYTLGATTSAAVTINNDDLPTVNVTPGTANQPDNGTSTTVTVSIGTALAPTGGFTVPLTTTISNAARASSSCGTSITIASGQSSNTCTVTGTANTIANDGTATVTVAPACSGTCTNGTSSVVTITDDDIPVITVACTAATLNDSAGQQSICRATTDKALSAAGLTINVTPPAANARYTLSACAATASFPANAAANSTVNICTIDAVANTALGDGNVTATVAVATGSGYSLGAPASASVVVQNDDLATISVAASPATVAENSGTPIVFTFTASAQSPNATNILFTPPAANASRYTTDCVSPIVLPANTSSVTCSVTPVNGTAIDGTATASVTVLPSAGNYTVGTASASGTITDDEIGVSVTGTGAVEGNNVSFSITCTGPAASTATVTFAISGQDSGATITPAQGPVTVTCGTPTTVTVSTTNDATIGNNRGVTLTLSNAVAPAVIVTGSATAAVADNDQPTQIPTLGTVGLGFLSLMLAGLAAFQRRRMTK